MVRRAIELEPDAAFQHYLLAYIEIQRGNAAAALAACQCIRGRPLCTV